MSSPERHRHRQEWELSGLAFGVASPGFWSVAISRQLDRIREVQARRAAGVDPEQVATHMDFIRAVEARTDDDNQLVAEAYFLLMAIDHLLRYAPLYRARTSDRRVLAALRTFEKDYGQVTALRDVVDHLEEYALGGGKDRQRYGAGKDEQPRFALAAPDPDDELLVTFGSLSVSLKAAAHAAQQLALWLGQVWSDALAGKTLIEPSDEPPAEELGQSGDAGHDLLRPTVAPRLR